YFEMTVFRGISERMKAEGYHILLHNVRPDHDERAATLTNLLAYRAAGYIVLEGAEGAGGEHVARIAAEGIPLRVPGTAADAHANSVRIDCRWPTRVMTDYVIGQGHQRLGHLAGPSFSQRAKERQKGFIESIIENDLPVSNA